LDVSVAKSKFEKTSWSLMMRTLLLALLFLWTASLAWAEPVLLGYGVKKCDELVLAWNEDKRGEKRGREELQRYRDWLGGFVSGLSLATGYDTLRGVSLDDAMQRIQTRCKNNLTEDVFNSTMNLVSLLEKIRSRE